MKNRALAAIILAGILVALITPLALAQTPPTLPTPTPTARTAPLSAPAAGPLDTRALAETMGQTEFKMVLLVTLLFGALGGLVYELMVLQGSIETPHRLEGSGWVLDLGVWGRMVMGALAAVAGLYVVSPENAYKLVAVAVVAGVSASAIFKSLQSRVEAVVAQQAVAVAQDTANQIAEKAEQMAAVLGVQELMGDSTKATRPPMPPSLESARRAGQLLDEIRALSKSQRRRK